MNWEGLACLVVAVGPATTAAMVSGASQIRRAKPVFLVSTLDRAGRAGIQCCCYRTAAKPDRERSGGRGQERWWKGGPWRCECRRWDWRIGRAHRERTGAGSRGRAGLSTCGNDTIAAGRKSKTVNNPAVTAKSHITVSLTSDPGSAQLLWVKRQAGSFTVHLTNSVSSATSFSYLIVEPFP